MSSLRSFVSTMLSVNLTSLGDRSAGCRYLATNRGCRLEPDLDRSLGPGIVLQLGDGSQPQVGLDEVDPVGSLGIRTTDPEDSVRELLSLVPSVEQAGTDSRIRGGDVPDRLAARVEDSRFDCHALANGDLHRLRLTVLGYVDRNRSVRVGRAPEHRARAPAFEEYPDRRPPRPASLRPAAR